MAISLSHRAVLVTGSTDGIGLHTAQRLAQAGADVLVHGRNARRVEAAVERVRAAMRDPQRQTVASYTADLSDLSQVRGLAAAVQKDFATHGLWALVNNAGVYQPERRLSVDGYELTWAVNVLAPFLLTSLLLPNVRGTVITTASISASSTIDFGDLQGERGYSAHGAYARSKFCNIAFTLGLASRLQAAGQAAPTANTLDPGTVNTKMLLAGWGRIGIEPHEADNTFKLVVDKDLQAVSGQYLVGHRSSRPPREAAEKAVQDRLWSLWEEQTGVAFLGL